MEEHTAEMEDFSTERIVRAGSLRGAVAKMIRAGLRPGDIDCDFSPRRGKAGRKYSRKSSFIAIALVI